ncbi:P-loop containing nucleoside triphosphate hydrolase protein [Dunaliella salina]|uniref:P-loop containing nucleoside triphosphate hydrolase protein n=1 Tax=Dunaliella salina TaxID=3046 RepID=A0ABQ7GA46_DUNSA|nr:P-loop containing nucleoside triphosphate hydrolase protein [Dunaliella salina]|eukprot:KAF5831480.1 P-loop containing nucleoside triphosphate hydrolase protein [Dunaliella salina]
MVVPGTVQAKDPYGLFPNCIALQQFLSFCCMWLIQCKQMTSLTANSVQVISPATSKKFGLSVDAVNKSLHPIMNDIFYEMSKDWRLQRLGFCKGDRIVQVRNDSDNGLANGDQGVVEQVTFDEDEKQRLSYTVSVDFTPVPGPGEKRKLVKYVVSSRSDLENHLRQAWSISVHKAQGGGFPIVVLFLHESMGGNLRMPMLYTAITRASGLLLILSTNAALTTKMIESKKAYDTTLMQRLKKLAN